VDHRHIHVLLVTASLCGAYLYLVPAKVMLPVYMRGYRGTRGTAPLILNLGARWTWVDSFMSQSAVWREPWYPPKKRLGGPQT